MARKKKPPVQKAGCPEWLATYGDLVTLVLTFFVLLYSFSTIDAEKWKAVVSSLSGNPSIFDGLSNSMKVPITEPPEPGKTTDIDVENIMDSSEQWIQIYEMVQGIINEDRDPLSGQSKVTYNNNEIIIPLSGDVLFDSGRAELKEESLSILIEVVEALRAKLPIIGHFRIEGHTDNVAQNSEKFANNWDLSNGRASSVLQFMLKTFKDDPDLSPNMFAMAGYGEYWPVASNTTLEGRAKNRRVDFVLVRNTNNISGPDTVPAEQVPGTDAIPAAKVTAEMQAQTVTSMSSGSSISRQ